MTAPRDPIEAPATETHAATLRRWLLNEDDANGDRHHFRVRELDAALAAARDEGRREALLEVRAGYFGDKSHWFGQWLNSLLDDVARHGRASDPEPLCRDPRHDMIESWYRQALELAAPRAEGLWDEAQAWADEAARRSDPELGTPSAEHGEWPGESRPIDKARERQILGLSDTPAEALPERPSIEDEWYEQDSGGGDDSAKGADVTSAQVVTSLPRPSSDPSGLAAPRAEGLDVDWGAMRRAGWEPDFNVCASCHHHGSRHDLNNVCLDCGDRFSSMSEDEQWAWAAAEYARLSRPSDERVPESECKRFRHDEHCDH